MAVEDLTMQRSAVVTEKDTPASVINSAPNATLLAVPLASAIAFAVHYWCGDKEPIPEPRYFWFLGGLFGFGLLMAIIQRFSTRVREWVIEMCPIIAGGI